MKTIDFLHRMHAADVELVARVGAVVPDVAAVVEALAPRIEAGGRLFYLGAGTSGRLGVLDASELPPTFGVDPKLVTALIAGGRAAMFEAREGAEDDAGAAIHDLDMVGIQQKDSVVGVAASGSTPYVMGGLASARSRGIYTVAVACCAKPEIAAHADITIAVDAGAEVLSGSTRLKAGTAQKLLLNMLSTALMARLGLIFHGEMIAMRPTNQKLRKRAVRITGDLLQIDQAASLALLEAAAWSLPVALVSGKYHITPAEAAARIAAARGNIASVLGSLPGEISY